MTPRACSCCEQPVPDDMDLCLQCHRLEDHGPDACEDCGAPLSLGDNGVCRDCVKASLWIETVAKLRSIDPADIAKAVADIRCILSGEDWSADTAQDVATVLADLLGPDAIAAPPTS